MCCVWSHPWKETSAVWWKKTMTKVRKFSWPHIALKKAWPTRQDVSWCRIRKLRSSMWVSWAEPRVYSWELREEELSLIICWANGWDLLGCPSRVEANASNEKRASLISPTATQHWAQYHYIHRVCRWWLSRSSHQHGNNGRTIILSLDLWISHSLFSSLPVYRIFSK